MKKMSAFINQYKFEIFSFFAIFFLSFCIYYNTTKFDFIYLDDDSLIIYKEQPDSLKNILFQPVFEAAANKFYRPIINLSFYIDNIICGDFPGFYHFNNILLHITAVFAVFLLFRVLGFQKNNSLILSLIYAVHPAFAAAVAWIPGRNDILLTIFIIFSFIFFIKSLKSNHRIYSFLYSFLFLLALFTKETAIFIPLIFILYLFIYEKNIIGKNIIKLLLLTAAPLAFYTVLRHITLSGNFNIIEFTDIFSNIFPLIKITFWYTGVVFMFEKIVLYPQFNPEDIKVAGGLISSAAIITLCVQFRKKINTRKVIFGFLWFIIFLIPTYIMPNNNYYVHRLYLPAVGIFIIINEIINSFTINKNSGKTFAIAALIILLFSLLTYNQSQNYKNRRIFWMHALNENPKSARVNAGIARYYSDNNDFENAQKYMLTALEYAKGTDNTRILTQTGDIYAANGNMTKAEHYYLEAIKADIYNEGAYFMLASLYEYEGFKDNAVKILQEGLAIMPYSKALNKKSFELTEGIQKPYLLYRYK